MKTTSQQSKGFTLVELLVVIAIIASLAAMATPAIMGAMKKAKVMTAKNICVSLENAVDRFESDYSYLPFEGSTPNVDTEVFTAGDSFNGKGPSDLMAVLAGLDDDINPKRIKYFTLNEPKGGKNSYKEGMHVDTTAKTAELYDPWGSPYSMTFDYDLDDEINSPFSVKAVSGKKVLVYSIGPDKVKPRVGMSNKEKKWIPRNF